MFWVRFWVRFSSSFPPSTLKWIDVDVAGLDFWLPDNCVMGGGSLMVCLVCFWVCFNVFKDVLDTNWMDGRFASDALYLRVFCLLGM